MKLWKISSSALVLCFSLGCVVPARNTYIYLDRPEASHSKDSVDGSPAIAYFEFHKIWLSATFQPTFVQLGVHVPEGQTAKLDGKLLEITQNIGVEPKAKALELIPMPADYKNVTPVNFMIGYKHDFHAEENFRTLSGGTIVLNAPLAKNVVCHKGYFFKAPISLPKNCKGSLKFPDLEINGTSYPGPSLSFEEKKEWVLTYVGP